MKKKILLATTGLLSVIVLGACSGSSNQDIATMKGRYSLERPAG